MRIPDKAMVMPINISISDSFKTLNIRKPFLYSVSAFSGVITTGYLNVWGTKLIRLKPI